MQAGDRVWVHADLPDGQSVHYLMVIVFLRGATNPPPDSWFARVETWNRPVHEEGVFVPVPKEAEEALVFLAPETGGAFSTLRSAVRGKPGAFVRAAQDLQQASLERQRLEKYLDSVSADADFANAVTVPEGFVEDALAIPPPKGKMLYIKLRDDPATIDTVALPLPQVQP